MLVIQKKKRKLILGRGILDMLAPALNFLSANKDTISNIASVIGNVAKAGADTATAIKTIRDVVKKKKEGTGLPKPLRKALTEKSEKILKNLQK